MLHAEMPHFYKDFDVCSSEWLYAHAENILYITQIFREVSKIKISMKNFIYQMMTFVMSCLWYILE